MLEKFVKFLREQAGLVKDKPELAKSWTDMASEFEKAKLVDDAKTGVEDTIAARITAGDLVPKAVHEAAVKKAKEDASNEIATERAKKEAADKKIAETQASRLKLVTEAGLDLKATLGKDRTIESTVAAMSCDEAGDKNFTERLEEWTGIMTSSGQFKASEKASEETASKDGKKAPPFGGGNNKATGDFKRMV